MDAVFIHFYAARDGDKLLIKMRTPDANAGDTIVFSDPVQPSDLAQSWCSLHDIQGKPLTKRKPIGRDLIPPPLTIHPVPLFLNDTLLTPPLVAERSRPPRPRHWLFKR